jgi:hypothetical protein
MIMAINNIKLLSMKKIFINIGLIPGLFAMLLLNACKENIDPVVNELSFNRAFTPTGLSSQISNITTVTLSWTAVRNADHYVVEICQGTDFTSASLVHTANIAGNLTTYAYVLPAGDTQFSARLKAVSSLDGVAESKWISAVFKTAPENLFAGYKSEMTGIGTCTVRWLPGAVATALEFDNGTNKTSYPLTAGEITAGVKNLSSIPNGKYDIHLMNSTFVRGKTNIFLEGNVLLAAGGDLTAAIASVPAGGVIILTNGTSFSFTGPVTLTKSVKIRGLNVTNQPTIFVVLNAATYHMFNIDAALTATDSLVFQNINISGYPDDNSANTRLRGMFDQDVTLPCNLGSLKFKNCILRNFDRHLVRLRGTAIQIINNIEIDNCIMYDYAFGSNYGVINSSAASSTIKNIKITNSTICYIRGAIISYTNGTACQGITITNCTFNQLAMDAATGRYVIDLNATTGAGAITIVNCIFGSTSAIANGIRPNTMTLAITGSYYTSDFNDGTTFPIKSFMTAYANASTALWKDPVTTRDFHFLDTGFAGKNSAGDPRWRP